MPEQTITCPYCKKEITLTDAISRPIRDQLRKELESEVAKREVEIRKSAEAEAKKEVALELKDLQDRNSAIEKKLDEAKQAELDLRKQRKELENKQKDLELEVARKLDEERHNIREQAEKKAVEDHRLKDLEKEKQINDMKQQIEILKRKAEQGSQQTQGEVFELELEETLKANFPFDSIEPVPKGTRGADILQRVHNKLGQFCGIIVLEVKQAKSWSDGWLAKLRDDQREVKADLALLMTSVLPKDIKNFANIEGVWVTDFASVLGLISALRINLIQVFAVKQASVGKGEKLELLYNYLSGPEFRHKIEAIVEGYVTMKNELDQEKRAVTRIWAKREKQIEKVLQNTAKMYGDMQGIIGASLPQIKSLDIKALTEGEEEVQTEQDEDMP